MARGYDSQFSRLYQIDPSAYEGPSTFEGLTEFLGVVNQYGQQQEEKKRYADTIAHQAEREAKTDSDAQAERDWRKQVYDDGQAEKDLANDKAAKALKYQKQKDAYEVLERNTDPGSTERLLGIKTGDFDLLSYVQKSVPGLEKNITERKRIRDVVGRLGVAEDATIPEIKDVLKIEGENLTSEEHKELRNLMQQRYALEDEIKLSPEYLAEEATLKNKEGMFTMVGVQPVLNLKGAAKLGEIKQEMIRKTGLAPTQYAPGAGFLEEWDLRTPEMAASFESTKARTGKYLFEGITVDVAKVPVDDKGELTEEAAADTDALIAAATDGDPMAVENVLEDSLSASETMETMVTPSPGRPSPDLAMIPQEQKEKDYLSSYELTDRQSLSTSGEDIKVRAKISKAYSKLPLKSFANKLGLDPGTIPSEADLEEITNNTLRTFDVSKTKYKKSFQGKIQDTKDYFLALESSSKEMIDRDPYGGKEARKKQVESVFAKYIDILASGKPPKRTRRKESPAISSAQRTLDVSTTAFPGK